MVVSLRRTETVSLSGSLVEKVATTEPMALPAASSVKLLVLISERLGGLFSGSVSTVRVTVLLASAPSLLVLPAASEKVAEATEMSPLAVLTAVGVKVAV